MFRSNDKSLFDQEVIDRIWRPCDREQDVLTGEFADVRHHIYQHGQEFGISPNHELRRVFSSPFNCCYLPDNVHRKCRIIHKPYMRQALAWYVYDVVKNAERRGEYEVTGNDIDFLTLVGMIPKDAQ